MPVYHLSRSQLDRLLGDAISMFMEYQNRYDYSEPRACVAAVAEVLDGLDADRELAALEPGEQLQDQLPKEQSSWR